MTNSNDYEAALDSLSTNWEDAGDMGVTIRMSHENLEALEQALATAIAVERGDFVSTNNMLLPEIPNRHQITLMNSLDDGSWWCAINSDKEAIEDEPICEIGGTPRSTVLACIDRIKQKEKEAK